MYLNTSTCEILFLVASPHTSSTRKKKDCGQLEKWSERPLMVPVCGVQEITRDPPAPQTAFDIVPSTYLICATSTATKIPRFVARMPTIHQKTLQTGEPVCTGKWAIFDETRFKTFTNISKVIIPLLKTNRETHIRPGKKKRLAFQMTDLTPKSVLKNSVPSP